MRSKVNTWLQEIVQQDECSPEKSLPPLDYHTIGSKASGVENSHFMSGFQEVLGLSNYQFLSQASKEEKKEFRTFGAADEFNIVDEFEAQ